HGVPVRGDRLFTLRQVRPIDPGSLSAQTGVTELSPTTWMVNSVRNRPIDAEEPRLLGQTRSQEARPDETERSPQKHQAAPAPVAAKAPAAPAVPMSQPPTLVKNQTMTA